MHAFVEEIIKLFDNDPENWTYCRDNDLLRRDCVVYNADRSFEILDEGLPAIMVKIVAKRSVEQGFGPFGNNSQVHYQDEDEVFGFYLSKSENDALWDAMGEVILESRADFILEEEQMRETVANNISILNASLLDIKETCK